VLRNPQETERHILTKTIMKWTLAILYAALFWLTAVQAQLYCATNNDCAGSDVCCEIIQDDIGICIAEDTCVNGLCIDIPGGICEVD